MGVNKGWIPLLLGGIIEMCLIGMVAVGDLGGHIPIFFLLYAGAAVAYCVGIWQQKTISLPVIWFFAICFRLTLLWAEPSLSDDIFRYVWDGRVWASGINPYVYAPDSEALAFLRDDAIYPFINHPHLPTLYPPVAQLFFLFGHVIFDSVWGLQVMLVGIDLLVGWVLLCVLKQLKKTKQAVVIYLWHPLIVVEGAGHGHMDFLGVLGLFLALGAWLGRRDYRAFGILGGAVLTKFLPVVMVPAFLRWSRRWFLTNWKALLVLPLVVCVGYMPFIWLGGPVWGSLGQYAVHWEFNSPIFWALHTVFDDGLLTRQIMGGLFALVIIWATVYSQSPLHAGFFIMAGFTLLTPTLHPWYLIWLIPFLVFYPKVAWIGFSLGVVLAYEVLIEYRLYGVWQESHWVWGIEWGVLLALGAIDYFVQKSKCGSS